MDSKFKAIYFALLMVTASLAGCVSQDDYDAAIEEHEEEKAEDAALIESLQNDLSTSEVYANALKAQLESLNATIEQSEEDLTALQAQHSAAKASLAAAEANATNLGQMVTLLEDQLAMAYSAMDVLNTTMVDMQQYYNDTMEEFAEQYNSTMANLSAQISAMSQSMSNLSATLNSTNAAYNSALSEVSYLQSQASSLNSTLAAKNEELANLEISNNFVSSLLNDFDNRYGTEIGLAIATESFGLKQQIYLTMNACWLVMYGSTGSCSDLWSQLEDDLPFDIAQSNKNEESIRYLSREMWNATTAVQPDGDLNDFANRLISEVEYDSSASWNSNGLYTEDSTKCWKTMYVSGSSEDCESVFLAWDSSYETDSQTFLNAEEGFLVGTTAYNTYDAYFCQPDVELTISRLLYTDVTIHIYNFGTTNETLIEPPSNTIGAVYGDDGGGVAYDFGSGSSLEIKDWSDPNGVCA
ncbi:hypothetical protein N9U68_00310 [Euryarchaeota archaeon]|nr:hypothetical protein [Euryarchaeota archaeon]